MWLATQISRSQPACGQGFERPQTLTSWSSLAAISPGGRMKSTSPVWMAVSGMLKSCDVERSCAITIPPLSLMSEDINQRRPVNNRIRSTTTTRPRIPLGKYPQLRLCGQEGSAPTNMRISTTSRMVPIDIVLFSFSSHNAPAVAGVPSSMTLFDMGDD